MIPKNKKPKLTPYEKAKAAQDRQRERNLAKVKSPEYKAKQLSKNKQQAIKARERAKTYKPTKKQFSKNKQHSPDEQAHIKKVVELGCIVCLNRGFNSQAEVHHISSGGMGLRSSNFKIIGLCGDHHRTGGHGVAIHAGKETFEAQFGTETELLEQVNDLIKEN
jgi:hypothetical protein